LGKDRRFVEAVEAFRLCSAATCPAVVREKCTAWLADAEAKSVKLRVTLAGLSATDVAKLWIDETTREPNTTVNLNPGSHSIRAETSNGRQRSDIVVLTEGANRDIRVDLAPAPVAAAAPTSSTESSPTLVTTRPTPVSVWILSGLGVVGIGAFAGFGLKARTDYDNAQSSCDSTCPHDRVQSIRNTALAADVSLLVGAMALGAATLVYLTRPAHSVPVGRVRWIERRPAF
jgi:hypothetical protein